MELRESDLSYNAAEDESTIHKFSTALPLVHDSIVQINSSIQK